MPLRPRYDRRVRPHARVAALVRRHYRFNEAGYRDSVELSLERPHGKRRITFIGDSFTAGHGIANVEDRFANRIRRARPDWDVNVLAANGFDTGNELRMVREALGRRLELDQVVLVYCLNDISDIVPGWGATLRRIFQRPPSRVIDHSYFLNLLYFRYRQARDPDIRRYYNFVADAYRGPIWERQQARLRELASTVHAGGGELRVVTFPFVHALGPGNEYVAIHGQLDEFWRTLGVPHLDLLSTYASHASSEMVVSREDAHPNARAHAMAADAIAPFIAANLE